MCYVSFGAPCSYCEPTAYYEYMRAIERQSSNYRESKTNDTEQRLRRMANKLDREIEKLNKILDGLSDKDVERLNKTLKKLAKKEMR